jgi:hypothetical protein
MTRPKPPQRIVRSASAFLDANGYTYVTITVPAGVRWEIGHQAVGTNIAPQVLATTPAQPVVKIYQDSAPNQTNYIEGTDSGDGDPSDSTLQLLGGESVTCEWETPPAGIADHVGLLATYVVRGLQFED